MSKQEWLIQLVSGIIIVLGSLTAYALGIIEGHQLRVSTVVACIPFLNSFVLAWIVLLGVPLSTIYYIFKLFSTNISL